MKPLTLAVCVTILAALIVGTCGCTSSSNTASQATATPTANPTADTRLAPDNLADAITARYKELKYTVNTPFTMTNAGSTITYHGVVTNATNPLVPYRKDITITLTKDKNTALNDVYDPAVAAAKARGMGVLGSDGSIGPGAARYTTVYGPSGQGNTQIQVFEPQSSLRIEADGIIGHERSLNLANVVGYYQVIVERDIPINQ